MKLTWFHHSECSTSQAEMLMTRYRARGVEVEKSLNADFLTWTVSARLPEFLHAPSQDRTWQQPMWRS